MMSQNYIKIVVICVIANSQSVMADSMTDALIQKYSGPSVEEQIILMDKDRNGLVDVYEVRAYLESQHGKGYQKELFDRWEASATGKSCGTSYSNELY